MKQLEEEKIRKEQEDLERKMREELDASKLESEIADRDMFEMEDVKMGD